MIPLTKVLFSPAENLRLAAAAIIGLIAFILPASGQQPIRDLEPTVILVAIDGFRYDYFEKHGPPQINELARTGVRAEWMKPVFPSKTFPNFYTIATGLYPANHGIVENNVWDFGKVFSMSDRNEVENPRWWLGEPIWTTAEKNGIRSAAMFYPGTETAHGGLRPTFWHRYDHNKPRDERVDQVLAWLDLPKAQRPRLITLYFHDIDTAGHDHGPDAAETRNAVLAVDASIKRLVDGLKAREIFGKANLILFSDHGMAAVDRRDPTLVDDYISLSDTERILWTYEFLQIFPKAGEEDQLIRRLEKMPNAECWKKSEIPKRFHYRHGRRVAPIVCSSDEGRIFSSRESYAKLAARGGLERTYGGHGYDNDLVSMRAMFVGHGGRFKRGYIAKAFNNVHVYGLIAKILDINPARNDGDLGRVKRMLQ